MVKTLNKAPQWGFVRFDGRSDVVSDREAGSRVLSPRRCNHRVDLVTRELSVSIKKLLFIKRSFFMI